MNKLKKAKIKLISDGLGAGTYIKINNEYILPCQIIRDSLQLNSPKEFDDTWDLTVTVKGCEIDIEAENINLTYDSKSGFK